MSPDAERVLYRVLLRLAPPRLRDRHAEEMEEAFLLALHEARGGGRSLVAVWLRATSDLLWSGLRGLRRRDGGRRPASERRRAVSGTELRYALRALLRQRFSTVLVLTMLALAIASNVVVFSLLNGFFLKPFPFREPERLVYVNEKAPRWNLERTGVNYPHFDQWRKAARLFEGIGLYDDLSFNLSDEGGAERIPGMRVTHDFLDVLGVRPLLGRAFTPEEDRPGGPQVALISEGMWRERFSKQSSVLGKTLRLNGIPHEIIGVLPRAAEFPFETRVWTPLQGDPAQRFTNYAYDAVARLKPGVSAADAEKDLLRAHQPIWDAGDKEKVVSPYARPLRDEFVQQLRAVSKALFGAVALLLIVACANVAAVMLARAIARRREMGIRLAMGATRFALARQLLMESALLSALGSLLGMTLGRWALQLLVAGVGDRLPYWASFELDARVLGFSVLLAMGTAVFFGWAPALHAVRGDLRGAMNEAATGSTASPRGRRTLAALVGAEFALCAVLLVSCGLLFRAFDQVRRVDPGFQSNHVLTFTLALPRASYRDNAARLAFWERLVTELRDSAAVVAAGAVSCAPLGGCHWGNFYRIEGRPPLRPGEADPVVLSRVAGDGYFEAMGLRLNSGRFFEARDGREGGNRAVIVNETFVRTFWPGADDAVGKRIAFDGNDQPWITVVGVVRDVKHYGLEQPMRPGLYFPLPQLPDNAGTMTLAIRTSGDPAAFAPAARALVQKLDASLPLFRMRTMETAVRESLRTRVVYSWMLAIFAAIALVLALGGAYGVTSYLVSQRTREIGIRMALGAGTRDVVGSVLRGSFASVGCGTALGLVAAVVAASSVDELLFGVPAHEPLSLAAAAVTLALSALFATFLPARRAARTDPSVSLRVLA
jgi:putative ABC transport system permease protein